MKQRIINYIRAGYPGLYLVSHEERVDGEMKSLAQELNYNLHFWSVLSGHFARFKTCFICNLIYFPQRPNGGVAKW